MQVAPQPLVGSFFGFLELPITLADSIGCPSFGGRAFRDSRRGVTQKKSQAEGRRLDSESGRRGLVQEEQQKREESHRAQFRSVKATTSLVCGREGMESSNPGAGTLEFAGCGHESARHSDF